MLWISSYRDYLVTRLPLRYYIPLSLFLTNAAFIQFPNLDVMVWCISIVFSFILVFQFRLWDDLSDLSLDRIDHPDRTLSKSNNIFSFYVLVFVLSMSNLCMLFWYNFDLSKLLGYLGLCLILMAWYKWRPTSTKSNLLNSIVVLAKYPSIVWIVSYNVEISNNSILIPSLLSVYFIFLIYEITHDDKFYKNKNYKNIMLLMSISLVSLWIFMALWDYSHTSVLNWFIWICVLLGTLLNAIFHIRNTNQPHTNKKPYGIFLIGFVAYLGIAWKLNL